MDWTWLLLLICPLMMIFMMKGMMHGSHGKPDQQTQKDLTELKNQNQRLQQELEEMKRH